MCQTIYEKNRVNLRKINCIRGNWEIDGEFNNNIFPKKLIIF